MDKWSNKSCNEVFHHACGVMLDTALYNRYYPNRYIASKNPYEYDKKKVCLFYHSHHIKFRVKFLSNTNQSPVNEITYFTFVPPSLLAQAQKRITTSSSEESGDSNRNKNPTPVFYYDQEWKKSGPPTGVTERLWHSFNVLQEK